MISLGKTLRLWAVAGLAMPGFFSSLQPVEASDNPLDMHLPGDTQSAGAHGHETHEDAHPPKKQAKPGKDTHAPAAKSAPAAAHGSGLSAEDAKAGIRTAMTRLKEGNERYVTDNAAHPRQNKQRRGELAKGQKPFAVVVACADSRVPPELLFDQGLGDLFVIRVAGQVIDDAVLGSIEYAVEHLNVPLVLVLGHESCGAVGAACKKVKADSHIAALVEAIAPAVAVAETQGGDLLEKAVTANVQRVMDELSASWPILAPRVRQGTLLIAGGVYDLDTGLVTFLY